MSQESIVTQTLNQMKSSGKESFENLYEHLSELLSKVPVKTDQIHNFNEFERLSDLVKRTKFKNHEPLFEAEVCVFWSRFKSRPKRRFSILNGSKGRSQSYKPANHETKINKYWLNVFQRPTRSWKKSESVSDMRKPIKSTVCLKMLLKDFTVLSSDFGARFLRPMETTQCCKEWLIRKILLWFKETLKSTEKAWITTPIG